VFKNAHYLLIIKQQWVQRLVGSVRFELTNSYAPGTNLTKLDHDPESNTRHNTQSKKVTSTEIAYN
jgi:hypothetical protein